LISSGTTRSLYAPVSSPSRPSQQNAGVQYFLTSPVCQRLFQPTKPYAATSMHHSVDHLITHGNVDQADHATTGWSTSVRTPALLQLIYDVGPSSADTKRRYGLVWLRDDDDDDDDVYVSQTQNQKRALGSWSFRYPHADASSQK